MRPLGRIQKEMLRCLKDHGQWFNGCGWLWDTPSNTERILNTLVKRGLVITSTDWSGHDLHHGTTVYKLNPLGEDNGD